MSGTIWERPINSNRSEKISTSNWSWRFRRWRLVMRIRFGMSRLSTRIMVIMLVPCCFLCRFVQHRPVSHHLDPSEFTALERQGFTLARSLALAEAERDIGAVGTPFARAMNHLLPLVGCGTEQARVFQPNGQLLRYRASRWARWSRQHGAQPRRGLADKGSGTP